MIFWLLAHQVGIVLISDSYYMDDGLCWKFARMQAAVLRGLCQQGVAWASVCLLPICAG